jgi:hypothetical protein
VVDKALAQGRSAAANGWVEAVITSAAERSTAVVVQLRNGERIEIAEPEHVDTDWLLKLLSGLSERR